MTNSKDLQTKTKMAAFSSAISEMLASVAGENAVLREILEERGIFSRSDFESEMQSFAKMRWQSFADQMADKISKLAERKLRDMEGGVVH